MLFCQLNGAVELMVGSRSKLGVEATGFGFVGRGHWRVVLGSTLQK